jgi:hypothetical protein
MQKLPYENVNNNIRRTPKEEENKSKKIIEPCQTGPQEAWCLKPLGYFLHCSNLGIRQGGGREQNGGRRVE